MPRLEIAKSGILSIDSETTGVDFYSESMPFFVTMCRPDGDQLFWEWNVNPRTREVEIPKSDVRAIREAMSGAEWLVGQNSKFDAHALSNIGIKWLWDKTHDTLVASHLLASNQPHDLTSLAIHYLGIDLKPYEDRLEKAVKKARGMVQRARLKEKRSSKALEAHVPKLTKKSKIRKSSTKTAIADIEEDPIPDFYDWFIAEENKPGMPSAGKEPWRFDYWLPREMARHLWKGGDGDTEYREPDEDCNHKWDVEDEWHCLDCGGHRWWVVLREYSNGDSFATIKLWQKLEALLKARDHWKLYMTVRELPEVLYGMEDRGICYRRSRLLELRDQYAGEVEKVKELCETIAAGYGYELEMPKGPVNNSLRVFCFDVMELPPIRNPKARTNTPALDSKNAIPFYLQTYGERTREGMFVRGISLKNQRATAVGALNQYERFGRPLKEVMYNNEVRSLRRLSPNKVLHRERNVDLGGGYIISSSELDDWYILHPNINQTATDTLRKSSNNPNGQNICLSGDSQILTMDGWVDASKLNENHVVAQYWKDTGKIDFVKPELQRSHFKGDMCHIMTDQKIDMLLTPNHRCLLRDRKTLKTFDTRADQFKEDYQHIHAGEYVGGPVRIGILEVIWLCAVQADGSYSNKGEEITFGLKKRRKIQRLRKTLDLLGANYSEKIQGNGVTIFYIGRNQETVRLAHDLMPEKKFGSWLLECDRETLDRFCKEVFFWDGDYTKNRAWTSSERENADWIQILFSLSSSRAMLATRMPGSQWAKREHHYVNVTLNRSHSMTTNFRMDRIPWDDLVYCVSVPSRYIVTRRNGKVSITGNSDKESECKKCEGEGCRKCNFSGKDFRSLRYCFGPRPGREWWKFDAKNIELRIPAYESKEEAFIALFERENDPPYFGSNHLLISHILFPKEFETCINEKGQLDGRIFKKRFPHLYKRVKNFDFAVQYGAVDRPDGRGTADLTVGIAGAQSIVNSRFSKQHEHNQWCIKFAEKHGYIETIPDREVDPLHGYPLICARTEYGRIKPTVPLNYRTQGSAMWWMGRAEVKVHRFFERLNSGESFKGRKWLGGYYIQLEVHDELDVDAPSGRLFTGEDETWEYNLPVMREVQRLMASCGDAIGIPTPVSCEFCPETWAEGVSV